MYFTTYALLAYTWVQVAEGFKLPFHLPWVHANHGEQTPIQITTTDDGQPLNRIAVIGAGAAGSTAAFWVAKAKERYGLDIEIDVFDSNPYIGGST